MYSLNIIECKIAVKELVLSNSFHVYDSLDHPNLRVLYDPISSIQNSLSSNKNTKVTKNNMLCSRNPKVMLQFDW